MNMKRKIMIFLASVMLVSMMLVVSVSAVPAPKTCSDSDLGHGLEQYFTGGYVDSTPPADNRDYDNCFGKNESTENHEKLREYFCADSETNDKEDIDCLDYNANCVTDATGDHCGCAQGYEFDAQENMCVAVPYCGDGVKNNQEECDQTDGVGEHETCNQNCELETLPYCGDGVQNNVEQCDGIDGIAEHQTCTGNCQLEMLPYCGDGQVNQQSETCDDGNFINEDGCSSTCQVETEVPEFSTLSLTFALIGALGVVVAIRRRN